MRLNTVKKIHIRQCTKIPIPIYIIIIIENLGSNDKKSPIMTFISINGEEMLDSDE